LGKYTGTELRRILGDAGVSTVSSHFGIEELRGNQQGRIAWAKDVGLTQMIVPSLGGPRKPTMDDVKRAADEYNKMGEQAAKAGREKLRKWWPWGKTLWSGRQSLPQRKWAA